MISPSGQLGTFLSSARFKANIQPICCIAENLYKLKPVQFTYKVDETDTLHYGLIAEEVDRLFPALVIKDGDGLPYTVRYEMVPILLLSEMQKQKLVIDDLSDKVTYLSDQIEYLMKCMGDYKK